MIIGLTGNIGCGKSSVSSILKDDYGVEIIDADLISREIYHDKKLLNNIEDNFPGVVVDGVLDRRALGAIVFADKDKLNTLNKITHGVIRNAIEDRIEESTKEIVVVDAALLFEVGFDDIVDYTVTVYCDEEVQLRRIVKRDSLSKEEAMQRINSQMSQKIKVDKADYFIDNSGAYEELQNKVYKMMEKIYRWTGKNAK